MFNVQAVVGEGRRRRDRLHWRVQEGTRGYKRVQAVRLGSVSGGGCYGVMQIGLSQKGNKCTFQMKEIGRKFGWSAKR